MRTPILTLVILFLLCKLSFSQTGIPKAQSMFIYNFCRLIEWPESYKTGDFIIGVVGNSTVSSELEVFTAGKKVGQQNIKILKFKDASEITKCHMLFISFGKSSSLPEIKAKVGSNSTLIIGEKSNFIEDGGAVNFVIEQDKLKFELRAANASKQGLKVSSSLVNMAINK